MRQQQELAKYHPIESCRGVIGRQRSRGRDGFKTESGTSVKEGVQSSNNVHVGGLRCFVEIAACHSIAGDRSTHAMEALLVMRI